MLLALHMTLPKNIATRISTKSPLGKPAKILLDRCVCSQPFNIALDKFGGWFAKTDIPQNVWVVLNERSSGDPDRLEKALDEIVVILHRTLAQYGVVAITSRTWSDLVIGQPGQGKMMIENPIYYAHTIQMHRLGLKSPLIA